MANEGFHREEWDPLSLENAFDLAFSEQTTTSIAAQLESFPHSIILDLKKLLKYK